MDQRVIDRSTPVTRVQAITIFFGDDPLSFDEIKRLSNEEKHELGALAARELGVELKKSP